MKLAFDIDTVTARRETSPLVERMAMALALLFLFGGVAIFALARWMASAGAMTGVFLCAAGVFTCLLALAHGRARRLAFLELLDRETDGATPKGTLFSEESGFVGDRVEAWGQFEKRWAPLGCLVLALIETAGAVYAVTRLYGPMTSPIEAGKFHYGVVLALGSAAFLFFLVGNYAAGLAYKGKRDILRAPAALSVFVAAYAALMIAALTFARLAVSAESPRYRNPEPFLLIVGAVALSLFALQHYAGLLLSLYRPRGRRRELPLPPYENRLAGLLARPDSFWEGVADFFEYQLGFKVSRTTFFAFFRKAVLPFFVFQLAALALVSCLVFVPAGRRGTLERWGKPLGVPLAPGFHLKWPWPFEKVYRIPADRVMTFVVGPAVESAAATPQTTLWKDAAEDAQLFLTANRPSSEREKAAGTKTDAKARDWDATAISLLLVNARVTCWVSDPNAYFYRHSEPEALARKLARETLIVCLAEERDGERLLNGGVAAFATRLKETLSRRFAEVELGVTVLSVTLDRVQPPIQRGVAAAFQALMGAEQQRNTLVNDAWKTYNQIAPEARTRAAALLNEARDYETRKTLTAKADAETFAARYRLSVRYRFLYPTLAYLDVFQEASRYPWKIVLATDAERQVISLDLKNAFNPELLDMMNAETLEKQ